MRKTTLSYFVLRGHAGLEGGYPLGWLGSDSADRSWDLAGSDFHVRALNRGGAIVDQCGLFPDYDRLRADPGPVSGRSLLRMPVVPQTFAPLCGRVDLREDGYQQVHYCYVGRPSSVKMCGRKCDLGRRP